MSVRAVRDATLILSMVLAAGCDNGLVSVRGVVTLDGEPLQSATVTFVRSDRQGRPASGMTDENGAFEMTTYQANDGLPPGEYRVLISKVVDGEDFKTASTAIEEKHRAAYNNAKSINPEFPQYRKVLPALYERPNNTPFSCSVPPPGVLRFELLSEP